MSLSPVIGTEVPETANGVLNSGSSENGPHCTVKPCTSPALNKSTCSEETTLEDNRGHTDNDCEISVSRSEQTVCNDGQMERQSGLDTETEDANQRTAALCLNSVSNTEAPDAAEHPGAAPPWDPAQREGPSRDSDGGEEEEGEKEKQDEEEDEKKLRSQHMSERRREQPSHRFSSSAPGPSSSSPPSPPPLLPSEDSFCPPHVMAEVWVRNIRGMQDSKSLDEISQACGAGSRGVGRGGQSEGRRATISSALELEGTVSHEGDLTNFITKNLEQKIKMSSKPSLDCSDSDCSGPITRSSRSVTRRPVDIPPIDPSVLEDLHKHTQEVSQSVEGMMKSLNGTIQNMTALSVGYIQTYRDSVDSLGESVDMSIKGMYTLMARCEELDRSMQPIHTLAAQIRDIKRTLDALEAICK